MLPIAKGVDFIGGACQFGRDVFVLLMVKGVYLILGSFGQTGIHWLCNGGCSGIGPLSAFKIATALGALRCNGNCGVLYERVIAIERL